MTVYGAPDCPLYVAFVYGLKLIYTRIVSRRSWADILEDQ